MELLSCALITDSSEIIGLHGKQQRNIRYSKNYSKEYNMLRQDNQDIQLAHIKVSSTQVFCTLNQTLFD